MWILIAGVSIDRVLQKHGGLLQFYADNEDLCTIRQEEGANIDIMNLDIVEQNYTNIEIF